MDFISKKRWSAGPSAGGDGAAEVPDPSSSDLEAEADDFMLVVSDEEANRGRPGHALSPNVIDESMILSDEEEPYDDDDDERGHQGVDFKPSKAGSWTNQTKSKYTNPVSAASSALMVEDKPWRKTNKTRSSAPDSGPPKSPPGRVAQLTKPGSFHTNQTPGETKRPILKYIRGFGVTSPQSPRRVQKPIEVSGPPPTGLWSDNENYDDNSSMSSETISYSSLESIDDSDDDMSMPLEDYSHHPERQPGFWNHLPYVPSHFVHDLNPSDFFGSATKASSAGCLGYLDTEVREFTLNDHSRVMDFLFALDHRFYLRALLQLLTERDEVGVEDSIHDDKNIIKKGPLRKKYLGKVKVKYLELRKGNLSYFGDGTDEGRRTVHLRSATASCNAIVGSSSLSDKDANTTSTTSSTANVGSGHNSGPGSHAAASLSAGLTSAVNATTSAASTITGGTSVTGFEFHLWVEGKRYAWLANSKNEQQSWVRAIRQAMIGDDDDWSMTLHGANAPSSDDVGAVHEEALNTYKKLQLSLQGAKSKKEYVESIVSLLPPADTPSVMASLHIPLKCLRAQMPKDKNEARNDGTSQQRRVKNSIAEFWNNLQKFDFAINGHMIERESPYAAERTIGSLVRCIMDFDRGFVEGSSTDHENMPTIAESPGQSAYDRQQPTQAHTSKISELDAVSYARSILLLVIKSKTSGDVEFAVENLLKSEGIVSVIRVDPSSALSTSSETVHIDVSFAGDEVVDHNDPLTSSSELSGWVMVRRSKYNSWKSRFCVFSEGVFSYYENAQPRPHGLRGQLLLGGATISSLEDEKERAREDLGIFILRLTTKAQDRERQFGFHSEDEFMKWKEAIQHELQACELTRLHPPSEAGATQSSEGTRESPGNKKPVGIIEGGTKLISYATDESLKAIKGATGSSLKVVKGGTKLMKDATGAFTKGATNLMFRSIGSSRSRSKPDESGHSIRRAPSLQYLMESTRNAKTGKREPTVQCVVQTTADFKVTATDTEKVGKNTSSMITVRVKFFQAYLLSEGERRLARGDATIEMDFIDETAASSVSLED